MALASSIRTLSFLLAAITPLFSVAADQSPEVSTETIPPDCIPYKQNGTDWRPGLRITSPAVEAFLRIPSASCRKHLILFESDDAILSQVAIRDQDTLTRQAAFTIMNDPQKRLAVILVSSDSEIGRAYFDAQPPRHELEQIERTAKSTCIRSAALRILDRITWWDIFAPAMPGKNGSTEKLQDALCTARVFRSNLNSVYGYAKSYAISVIKAGDSTKLSGLHDLLRLFGDKDFAMLYLNSGRTELHVQAVGWVEQNGLKIGPFGGTSEATWGRKN